MAEAIGPALRDLDRATFVRYGVKTTPGLVTSSLWIALLAAGCGRAVPYANGDDDPDVDAPDTTDPDGGQGDGPNGDATNLCAAAEVCDGVIDDDCNGTVDDGCPRCPLMTISCPSGCCAIDRWEVNTVSVVGSDLAVDAAGNIYYAYTVPSSGAWTSRLAIYDAQPGTWRDIPLSGGTYRNRVRLDAQGRLHIAYASPSGGIGYVRSDDRGLTFTPPSTVGTLNIGGTFDMELDSAGTPYVVFAMRDPVYSWSRLRYVHLAANQWVGETVDAGPTSQDHPDLTFGFANRPHIVYNAYQPPGATGSAIRYVFHNGNRWIGENLDVPPQGQAYTSDDYFAASSTWIAPDDSREVLFVRSAGTAHTLYLARRGTADTDPWQVNPITGVSEFTTPILFVDHHGKHGAVSDGLRLHREQAGTSWATTPLAVPGMNVAVARRGRYLYLAFTGGVSSGKPTITVVDLGP